VSISKQQPGIAVQQYSQGLPACLTLLSMAPVQSDLKLQVAPIHPALHLQTPFWQAPFAPQLMPSQGLHLPHAISVGGLTKFWLLQTVSCGASNTAVPFDVMHLHNNECQAIRQSSLCTNFVVKPKTVCSSDR
jgi:hypothetical protein